ncbi:hypothetical protein KCU95_g14493, partial [Aureobasidium melanogenum]
MDNPPEPMPKVSVDPLPPAESPSPSSPPSPPPSLPPPEHIVVTSHEGSVVAVPAAEPTLEKAVTPPAADPKPPSPPPAPPVVVAVPETIPPPASPVVSPAPVIIQQVEPISAQAPAPAPVSPSTVVVEKVKEAPPAPSPTAPAPAVVVVESPAPSSPIVTTTASTAPVVPLIVKTSTAEATIGRSDTAAHEPQKKSDKVPVLIATRSAPELQQGSHEVQARPSVLSFRSAPPDTFVRRDTHVVVIDPSVNEHPKRHWRDRVRRFWVSKLGGRFLLRLLLGEQGSNVATAVVSRY